MATKKSGNGDTTRDVTTNRAERHSSIPNDLPDTPHDQERLQADETTIELPDVKDIPGQEFVQVPPMGMMADTTIASDDEEGAGIFDDAGEQDEEPDYVMGTEADVSEEESRTLARADYMRTQDKDRLKRASMDSKDFQGEALNERSFGEEQSGRDLDIPGNTDETKTDALGQGDEENKHYSLGSDDNDTVVEGTP
ncbi:MAG: hypothetical protein M3342_15890 [Bacteroidota bacterium]|nr:hypothetical protein [Flavisolibacter sp.]MBD0367960.1 hypothetical protein [Flavisolibacter sp.]MBD0377937.1 hypothetical protein [Flavisolibacter sp.]MDQ3845469.1 hypothetical protein [Bacteroidota bacterium]